MADLFRDEPSLVSFHPSSGSDDQWLQNLNPVERGLTQIHLIFCCANQIIAGNLERAHTFVEQLILLSSSYGDTVQRIALYFTMALRDLLLKTQPGLCNTLFVKTRIRISEAIHARNLFFEFCPLLKLALLAANYEIIKAVEGENNVHIIDINSLGPAQCVQLLRELKARSGGPPPGLKITSIHENFDVLEQIGNRLAEEAKILEIPFEFIPIVRKPEEYLELACLRLLSETGSEEAVVINSYFQSVPFLRMNPNIESEHEHSNSDHDIDLGELHPKVMVVIKQAQKLCEGTLIERLSKALQYYAALFDCLENTAGSKSAEASRLRIKVEKVVFGVEIWNIIGCEEAKWRVREEMFDKWIKMLDSGGFEKKPLSLDGVLMEMTMLKEKYNCDHYRIKEEDGCTVIGWDDVPVFSVSAWMEKQ